MSRCTDLKATFCWIYKGYVDNDQDLYQNYFCADCLEQLIPAEYIVNPPTWWKLISLFQFDNVDSNCPSIEEKKISGKCVKKRTLCGAGYEYRDSKCVRNPTIESFSVPDLEYSRKILTPKSMKKFNLETSQLPRTTLMKIASNIKEWYCYCF